jgi:glycosyltransferase involved in cell wall biosynthesis
MMGLASWVIAWRHRTQCCLSVQDLFPQNAVDLGLLKNKMAILFFEALERLAYRAAGAVVVHSEGNRAHIVARGKPADQVHSLPNWVDTNVIRPAERHNDFRREHHLQQEFIVSFAGAMGWSQGLEVVIEAARLLAREPDLLFLLIGGGTQRERLGRLAEGLPNVRFLPMQSQEKYPSVLAASDACLVTLRPEVATPVVPSKLLTIMSAGRPVLASVPLAGDAPRIVNDAACGFVVPPGDAQALADAVLCLKRDSGATREKAENGRKWAERHFSRAACICRFESLFRSLSRRPEQQAARVAAISEEVNLDGPPQTL